MGLDAFAVTIAAECLFTRALDEVSGRVRRSIVGTEHEQAIQGAYRSAIDAFIQTLPPHAEDYVDVFEHFFHDDIVIAEFALLLDPSPNAELSLVTFRDRLHHLGFDFATLPAFSLERAIQSFATAFTQAAANDADLRSVLSYQALQRIDAKLTTLVSLHDQSSIAVEQGVDRWIIQDEQIAESVSGKPQPSPADRVYRYPSQQFVRFIGLGVTNALPPESVALMKTLAMTRDDWVAESEDTSEITMDPGDLVLVLQALNHVKDHIPEDNPPTSASLMKAVGRVVVQELKKSIRLQQQGTVRPVPAMALQMEKAGIPYVVLGVNTQFAGLFEVLRVALHPSQVTTPERGTDEILFESLEDAQQIFTMLQDVHAKAGGDNERAVELLLEGAFNRVMDRAVAEHELSTGQSDIRPLPAADTMRQPQPDQDRESKTSATLGKLRSKPASRKAKRKKRG